jgi:predicted Zn finger-like uncharacterized protein
MKITCQACAAKYTIADEKVLGKVVKIRCKKCGASIVINGNDPSGASVGAADAPMLDYAEGGSQAWTVNVAEGDQRAMEDAEIVSAYRSGVVNDETYCWKEGMGDWLPLREIAQLYGACTAGRGAGPTDPPGDDAATKIQAPPAFLLGSSPPATAPAQAAHGGQNGSGAHYPPEPAAPTARRAPGRSPGADLFGAAAQAGGEDDVMTSAPAGIPQAHEARGESADKLTGARNENSVLFSLNALTSKGGVMPQKPLASSAEASGLIDIRQLSAQIGLGERKESRIDDIMNLAGGGAFSPSLTAPVLSAPPLEDYAAVPQASLTPAAMAKNKKLMLMALGGGAFLVVAAIGVALMLMHRGSEEASEGKEKPAASASAESPSASASGAAPAGSVAANDTAQPSASEAPQAAAPAAGGQDQGKESAPKEAKPAAAAAQSQPKESAAAKPKQEAPAGVPAAVAAAAGGGAAASDAPFNMGEAKSRLAAAAAGVQSCKKGDQTGTGRVVIVFLPNGTAQSATVTGSPFEGTPAGGCVAARFRGVRVPPFGGSPFSVAKSFTIN